MKEYSDNDDNYIEPVREFADELIEIRLYCNHEGCKQYIKGIEGYNGSFTAETGEQADLRNQTWICNRHSSNNIQSLPYPEWNWDNNPCGME